MREREREIKKKEKNLDAVGERVQGKEYRLHRNNQLELIQADYLMVSWLS